MSLVRVARIAAIAVGFFVAFHVSQAATAARSGGQTLPGIEIAIGVLSLFFLVGAFANEQVLGPEMDVRKDLLWGLGGGGIAIVAARIMS